MYAKFIERNRVDKLVSKGAMLIDMRTPVEFRNGSVDGAVNLPLRNFLNTITGLNKSTELIMFSENQSDPDLMSGVNYAMQLGFNTLYISEYRVLSGE